jgi:polar amino acid transport system permease protein
VLAAFDWSVIWENRGELAQGLARTLEVAFLGIIGAFAIGLVLGAARAHRVPGVSQVVAAYVELIRNTPILVQIFFLYYGLPRVAHFLTFDAFAVATLAVMIWGGAFNTENFRAGFEAVPARYREAALALGFSRVATFFNVTLPIGGRIALPSSINTYIAVLKNTALMTAIGFPELTNTALDILSLTFRTYEMFLVLAVVYLGIVWALSALIRVLERRLALPEER